MGALGGLLKFDGGQVEESWLRALSARLARRAPDDEVFATGRGIGMVYRAYGASTDEQAQSWLWQSPRGAWLAFDGRLDNGSELAQTFGLHGADASCDAAILLEGFHRRGPSFVGDIVGDFALAYWDPTDRTLTLGRDAAGVRPLYYHHGPRLFAFATDLGSLVGAARIDPELDEDHIAAYLGSGGTDECSTIYRHVRAVEPAQVVTVSGDGRLSKRIVWSLPYEAELLRYSNEQDYVEQFAQLFTEAVRVRLRTPRPVVAELSGGIDSSSVACMADHLIRTGVAKAPALSTASRVCDISKSSDESRFRNTVERHIGRRPCLIRESEFPVYLPARNASSLHVLGLLALKAGWEMRLSEHMQSEGAHVLFSGLGGDEMFQSINKPESELADLLVHGRLMELHRRLLIWSSALKQPYTKTFRESFKMALPRRWLPNRLNPDSRSRRIPTWIHPRLREKALAGNEGEKRRLRGYRLPSQREHAAGYYSVVRYIARGERQEFEPRYITYPCIHRPLVEFLYVVPFSQKLRVGESRSLQRRALRDLLPQEILVRRGKGVTTEASARSLRAGSIDWDALLTNSIIGAREYVDIALVKQNFARANAGLRVDGGVPINAFGLETWLRFHESRGRNDRAPVVAGHVNLADSLPGA